MRVKWEWLSSMYLKPHAAGLFSALMKNEKDEKWTWVRSWSFVKECLPDVFFSCWFLRMINALTKWKTDTIALLPVSKIHIIPTMSVRNLHLKRSGEWARWGGGGLGSVITRGNYRLDTIPPAAPRPMLYTISVFLLIFWISWIEKNITTCTVLHSYYLSTKLYTAGSRLRNSHCSAGLLGSTLVSLCRHTRAAQKHASTEPRLCPRIINRNYF